MLTPVLTVFLPSLAPANVTSRTKPYYLQAFSSFSKNIYWFFLLYITWMMFGPNGIVCDFSAAEPKENNEIAEFVCLLEDGYTVRVQDVYGSQRERPSMASVRSTVHYAQRRAHETGEIFPGISAHNGTHSYNYRFYGTFMWLDYLILFQIFLFFAPEVFWDRQRWHKEDSMFDKSILLNYRFVCRCHACYEDALQGANLRCHSCSGPVVIESALDLEPALYGRCLLCYEKYEDIENAIKLLKSTKKSIESTHVLAKTAPERVGTLQRVIEQTQILMDLSIVSSMFNRHHIELSSITIQLMGQTFEQHYSWAEKMRLALLFCKHLAVEVPADVVNGKMLSNLHFWMQTLQRCIGHFYQVAKPSFSQKEEMNMWNGMLSFYSRLARAIGSLEDGLVDASDKEKHLLERLVERELTAKRQLVDAFLRQFQPQGAQLKIYGYNMWLRLGRRQVV